MMLCSSVSAILFLSTPSARRATQEIYAQGNAQDISIHALREEGDKAESDELKAIKNFYPRPPRGGRLIVTGCCRFSSRFLSTPSARRATMRSPSFIVVSKISIHALREEGDRKHRKETNQRRRYFYPRPPRGGRLCYLMDGRWTTLISIHALREEGDFVLPDGWEVDDPYFYPRPPRGGRQHRQRQTVWKDVFLSTPSARRATSATKGDASPRNISIHALREEGDGQASALFRPSRYFYPRPPRGGRPVKMVI